MPSILVKTLSMDRLTDTALESRPEMRRVQLQEEAALDRLKGLRRTYLPSIGATGWYGRYLPDYPDAIRGAWGYGVGATWNLFDGMATTYRVKELEARLDQDHARAKRQSQNIVAEVASAYMNLMRAEQNEAVADKALEFAKQNFHYAQLRFDADVGTILELLVAETSLVNADAVQVQAATVTRRLSPRFRRPSTLPSSKVRNERGAPAMEPLERTLLKPHDGGRAMNGSEKNGHSARPALEGWKRELFDILRSRLALAAFGVFVLLVGLRLGVNWYEHRDLAAVIPTVRVARPAIQAVDRSISLPGDVEAIEQARLYSHISGYLKKIYVDEGDSVKAGQLLAEIDAPDIVQEYNKAKADANLKDETLKRYRELLAGK